jgi:hypothetical protein
LKNTVQISTEDRGVKNVDAESYILTEIRIFSFYGGPNFEAHCQDAKRRAIMTHL